MMPTTPGKKVMLKRLLPKHSAGLFLVVLMIAFCAIDAAAREPGGRYVVVIDPAHGGGEKGVSVTKNLFEKDITLALAKQIQKYIEGKGTVKAELTRTADRDLSFAERERKTETLRADLFISLHVNAGFDRKASGFEVYFPGFGGSSGKGDDGREIVRDMVRTQSLNESVRYGRLLLKHMEKIFPRKDRGLREAPLRILRNPSVPSVVLETCFATDPAGRKDLQDESKQKGIAEAVGKSIQEFFGND